MPSSEDASVPSKSKIRSLKIGMARFAISGKFVAVRMTLRGASALAGFAVATDFGARHGDFHPAVLLDLLLELLVELALEFAYFAASQARDVNVIARPVALIKVPVSPQMQQVELVDQSVMFKQVERAVYGNARNSRVDFFRARQNFSGV